MKLILSHFWFVFVIASTMSCNNSSLAENTVTAETPIKDSVSETNQTESARPVHWSYGEEGGPDTWAKLSPVYALCGSGKTQSPVNLLSNTGEGSSDWTIDYKTTSLQITHNEHVEELINNGHTIQVTPEAGSKISYKGKVFYLKQFHFHTPSEHTINGKHFPMEIHLVHQADDGSLAVLGALVKEGNHNNNFNQLIQHLPNAIGEKKTENSVKVDVGMNVPKDMDAYHYVGSLTTPPCTENVQWIVLKNPISLSKEQVEAFSVRLKNNNRPVQKINERKITMDHIKSKS